MLAKSKDLSANKGNDYRQMSKKRVRSASIV